MSRTGSSTYRSEAAQSTVEFALALPVLVALLLGLVQVAVIARDQVMIWSAAGEAARQAAVGHGQSEVNQAVVTATPGLDPERLLVQISSAETSTDLVTVTVTYSSFQVVPFLPADSLEHQASVVMARQ